MKKKILLLLFAFIASSSTNTSCSLNKKIYREEAIFNGTALVYRGIFLFAALRLCADFMENLFPEHMKPGFMPFVKIFRTMSYFPLANAAMGAVMLKWGIDEERKHKDDEITIVLRLPNQKEEQESEKDPCLE